MPRVDGEAGGRDTAVQSKLPCPNCGRKQFSTYADGHGYCHRCGHKTPATIVALPSRFRNVGMLRPNDGSWTRLDKRKLESDTLRKFGFFSAGLDGQMVQVAPVYDQTGRPAMQVARTRTNEFVTLTELGEHPGALSSMWLFGRHVWGDKHDKKVVVFTGFHDAMSAAQVTRFKFPCVSINTAEREALAALKANYLWLDRFQEIVLFFDGSEVAQALLPACASLFDAGKVKIAKLENYKDASAALQAGNPGEIEATIYSAYTWRPTGIVNAADGLKELLEQGLAVPSWPYPWGFMNERSLGMRKGEVSYHVGGTGIAKTTLMFHYATHLMKWDGEKFAGENPAEEPAKVGWFGFEDNLRSVKLGLLSIHAGRRLHLNPVANEEAERLYNELFGNRRLELYDPESAEYGMKAIIGYSRYMAKALDCYIQFIDPLSYLIASLPLRDRVQAEDAVAAELASMAKSLGVHYHIGYHLKKPDGTPFEEGREIGLPDIRGSGALTQFSNNVWAYERNQQGERPDLLRVRGLKLRFTGLLGVAGMLKYDSETGRYSETTDEWPEDDDDKHKQGNRRAGREEPKEY